jgi:hypothetical protein
MHRTPINAVAVTAAVLLSLTSCGGGSSSNTGSTTQVKKIAVTFSGDQVTPSGERIDVSVNQPIELDVTADKAGEIHVHSDPEQELQYGAGTTVIKVTPIDKPGVVDVESHSLDATIVQLEVR